MLQSTTNRRRRLRRDLHGHESARGEFGRSALQESVPLRHRLGVVQRAQRDPVCARIVLQAPTGPQGRLNVRQPELLPLRHHLPRHACSSSITMRSLQLSAAARKNGVYGAVTNKEVAAEYMDEATMLSEKAQSHRKLAKLYRGRTPVKGTANYESVAKHCEKLADLYEQAAKEASAV